MIFDTGAGINNTLSALVRHVDSVIVVVEPDEISLTSALDLQGELALVTKNIYFVVNKSTGTAVSPRVKDIEYLPSLPMDQGFHAKFVKNARNLAHQGFRGTRYKRYLARIANRLFGMSCSEPTPWDYILSNRLTRHIVSFIGYGISFFSVLILALVLYVWFLE